MIPIEWVDSEEWAAIELAFDAVEDQRLQQSTQSHTMCRQESMKPSDEAGLPEAKRVRRQLPASWFAPPVGQYRAEFKFPSLVFKGNIVYSKTSEEAEEAVCELMQGMKRDCEGKPALGFDIEWKPAFQRGVVPGRTAVLQLCPDSSRCYIFHIFHCGIPQSLQDLLEGASISKTGVGIQSDADKLKLDYGIRLAAMIDLSAMANHKLATSSNWSLSGLAQQLTCKRIEKPADIRCGDWEAQPLSQSQLTYAATDAFASLHLYQVLASFDDQSPQEQEQQNQGGTQKS